MMRKIGSIGGFRILLVRELCTGRAMVEVAVLVVLFVSLSLVCVDHEQYWNFFVRIPLPYG